MFFSFLWFLLEGLCVGKVESAPNNTDCCNAGKTEGLKQNQPVEVNLVGTVKTNMSQLCREFAQDFSQIPESRDHFSPSACLSAMKKAKQKAGEGNPHHQCNSISNSMFPISDVPVNDSGFHSAVVNATNLTASSFSENIGLSRTHTELKSEFHTETVFPPTKAFPETGPSGTKADIELIRAETSKEKEVDPGRANKSPTDVTIQQPSRTGDIHSVAINDPKHDGQTKKTSTSLPAAHSLGFKTASNKGIHISSASLKRAKQIFKETESETAFYDQPTTSDCDTTKRSTNDKTGNISTFSLKPTQTSITETFGNITPQLTASQTDDVTELCSLLEQTDSQFELTPFKTLKAKQQDNGNSPQKADKELDPDFLAGIDFDDSFSSDLLQCARNENISPSLKNNSQDEASVVSDDPQRAVQASKLQSKVSGVAFKTAGGKVLRVSDKCLSKAKALFADLDGFATNRKSSSNKSTEIGFNTKQKCAMDPSRCTKNPTYTVEEDVHAERVGNCFKNHEELASENEKPQTPKQHVSGCSVTENAKLLPCRTKEPNLEMVKVDSNQRKALKSSAPFHRNSFSASKPDPSLLCITSKTIDSNEKCPAAGFCTAGGKKGFVSTDKMENSEYLLEEIHTPENGTGQLEENKRTSKAANPTDQGLQPKICGFQTAGGKELTVSFAALKKAQELFSENEGVKEKNSVLILPSRIPSTESSGFCTAIGKPVGFSSQALQKAKAFFSDISVNTVQPGVLDAGTIKKHKDVPCNGEKMYSAFTASNEADAYASEEHHLKSKHLLKDFDLVSDKEMQEADVFLESDVDAENAVFPKDQECQPPLSEMGNEKISNPGQRATLNFSEPVSGCPEDLLSFQKVGFQTAGGANVHVSTTNLIKAKHLFKDLDDLVSDKEMQEADVLLKGDVDAENAVLPKEQECQPPLSEMGNEKTRSDPGQRESLNFSDPVSGCPEDQNVDLLSFQNVGFQTAGGAKVHVFSFSGNKADISQKWTTEQNQNKVDNKEKIHFGFQTAGGAKVHVSKTNLIKAKHLFKNLDDLVSDKEMQEADVLLENVDVDAENAVLTKDQECQLPLSEGGNEMVRSSPDERGSGPSEDTNQRILPNVDLLSFQNVGFQTANGKAVTFSSESLRKAKSMFNGCEAPADKTLPTPLQSKASVLPFRGGFCSASGTPASASSEAVSNAKSLFSDISSSGNKADVSQTWTTEQNQDKVDDKEKIHLGFQTAGGAKVHVSKKNLIKAKHLFKDEDDSASKAAQRTDFSLYNSSETSSLLRKTTGLTADLSKQDQRIMVNPSEGSADGWTESRTTSVKEKANVLLHQNAGFQTASGNAVVVSSEALKRAKALLSEGEEVATPPLCKIPVSASSGFFAASGKAVTFSSKALQKAKSLFSDIRADGPDFTDTKSVKQKQEEAPGLKDKMLCGFTSAGGRVCVAEKSPGKADNLVAEVADDCRSDSSGFKKLDLFNVKDVSRSSDVDLSNLAPSEAAVQSETYKQETSHVMVSNSHHVSGSNTSRNTRAEESSALIFQSLNLTGCTETQHRLLAQEALDCTKALLEDEDLAGLRFSPASQNALKQDYPQTTSGTEAEEKGPRKRLMGDPDPTGQPPLKRQLLEEFNQTNDGSKDSALQPVKSCPLGLMKDRGVFKYSSSLYPNITKPHYNGKTKTTTVQPLTPDDSRSTRPKMSPFVPPFHKNARSEASKTTVIQQATRTPVFVPPLKKRRAVLQGEKDQNTNQLPSVTESNSISHVPSTINAQECSNALSIVNTHPNNKTNNPNVDVNGGSVCFESHAVPAFSKVFLNTELGRDMQDMRIRKKKRQNIRPLQGSLFLTKTSGVAKIPLKDAVNGKLPARCPPEQLYRYGVHRQVSGITSETAESFRFDLLHFFKQDVLIDEGGVKLADGGCLIPSKDGTAGKEEFFRALCDTPGVDPKLITEAWGYNHYKWIIWKQASMEKSFPERMGGICLTPEQVLLQLKYRYDVEVDHSRRPALRKITEKDDTAAKTLVLCVCGIASKGGGASGSKAPESSDPKTQAPTAVIWLTDGWYAIKAQLDQPLTAMLNKGLLAVGGKLVTHGAQLVGSQDACPPLEAPESLMLKICANSTRRARWDTKLGFHRDPRPFLLPIASLFSNGGPVGCADVVVLRSYPVQWMERKADGGVVFRTTRAEEKEARRFDEMKQKAMEVLFAKVQAEFKNEEREKNKSLGRKQNLDVTKLQDGEELHAAVGDDPTYLEAHLSEQQLQTLHAYKRSLMERKQAELQDRYHRALEEDDQEIKCPKRDVTPVWRLSVADSLGPPSCVYQLSLWRPSSDVESLLKEGGRYKVYNLATAEGKKRSSHETVQLTGTKKTQFQVLQASQQWMSERFQPRVSTDFESLQNPDFRPLCGEVDLSGYVVSVIDAQGSSPAFYLADGKLNLVKIRCFSSLSQTGLEDVVKPRVLLALSNLQLRGQSMFPTPVVYAGDLTLFSINPKEGHLQESLSQLKNAIQHEANFHVNAEEKLSHLIKSGRSSIVSPMTVKQQTLPLSSDKKDQSKASLSFP
uniref:Tower domain-containing protein n=1 Tax=Oryzias latipes TaxID=8090 RepID=A0A3P9KTE3_ORYLA